MRGLKRLATAALIAAGHAFVQNLRRGHYELGIDIAPELRLTPRSPNPLWRCETTPVSISTPGQPALQHRTATTSHLCT